MTQALAFAVDQKTEQSDGADHVEPAAERRSRSFSQMSSFRQCSWAFYLQRVRKLPETPSVWFPGGTAFHLATEQYDELTWNLEDLTGFSDPAPWQNTFTDLHERELDQLRVQEPNEAAWRAANSGKESISWWQKKGRDYIAAYLLWRAKVHNSLRIAEIDGKPAIELEVNVELGGVPVRGFVDRLYVDINTGVYLLVDYKTGKSAPTDGDQPGLYSVMVEEQFGLPVTFGAFYNARKGDLGDTYDLTGYTKDSLGRDYARLDREINAGNFQPTLSRLCKSCGVKQFCKYVGGSEPAEDTEEV